MTENTTASGAADLPEFPGHPESHNMMWTALEIVAIRKYGADMFRAGRLAASAPVAPAPQQPAPSAAAHVGDSLFESWFSEYNPAHRGTKQQMRDAYAAGMGDPKAQPSPTPQADSQPTKLVEPDGRLSDELRNMIEGMSVSVDVSTGDHDAGRRYFGTVTEVMDDISDKHGVTLLVQDAEPNFAPTPPAQAAGSVTAPLSDAQWQYAERYKKTSTLQTEKIAR